MVVLPAAETLASASRVVLVQWKDVNAKTGYIVDLDKDWLLVTVVHVGGKRFATDYSDSQVLVPQTGVTYTRARRVGLLAENNSLPPKWIWLMKMWRAALNRATETELYDLSMSDEGQEQDQHQPPLMECLICKHRNLTADVVGNKGPCFTCPLCLLQTHDLCAKEILQYVVENTGASSSSSSSSFSMPTPMAAGLTVPEELLQSLGFAKSIAIMTCVD